MQIMMRAHVSSNLALVLAMAAFSVAGPAEETPVEAKAYPLWDGKESVAAYAKRAGLEPEMSLDLGDRVKMDFVLIPAGKFMMGSPEDEKDHEDNEGPRHEVTIDRPFYMGKFEVTQEQYEKLIKKNPSYFKGARNPVERVSWDDAQAFCKKLNEKTNRPVRLPSEAEWEYACRAGSKTPIHPPRERRTNTFLMEEQRRRVAELIPRLGNDEYAVRDKATRELIALGKGVIQILDGIKTDNLEIQGRLAAVKSAFQPSTDLGGVAWHCENSGTKTHHVGGKEPNEFGLYDMLGNVFEWCEDDYHNDYAGAPTDGSACVNKPRVGDRVSRGGAWDHLDRHCRSAYRGYGDPEYRGNNVGFRVVLLARGPR
jgi:formylglycine-generating enzyme required for sulfatase activity